ncbi:MAG: tetratricopeptide repeat protein [Alphaproteobacteria bacterium]|nr:tetratricopeptide repeat protein [Alphaproteobacteria bacterium]
MTQSMINLQKMRLLVLLPFVLGIMVACDDAEQEGTSTPISETNFFTHDMPSDLSAKERDTVAGEYLISRIARHQGDWDKAADTLQNIVDKDQENLPIWHKLLFLSLLKDDPENAKKAAEFLFKNEAEYDLAYITIFADALGQEDFKKAAEVLTGIEEKKDTDSHHYALFKAYLLPVLKAWLSVAENNLNGAITNIDQLTSDPDFTPVYALQKAFILEYAKQPDKAERYYELAFASAPVTHMAEAAGNFYERQGKFDKAKAVYNKFNKLKPQSWFYLEAMTRLYEQRKPAPLIKKYRDAIAEAIYDIGGAFYAQGYYDTALYYNTIALLVNEDLDAARYMVGSIFAIKEFPEQALLYLDKIKQTSFYYYKAEEKKAEIFMAQGEAPKAIFIIQNLLKIQPEKLDLLLNLSRIYYKEGNIDRSIDILTQCLNLSPPNQKWLFYFERGQVYQAKNETKLAEDDFLKALELNSENPTLLNHIGYTWLERGVNYEDAQELIERALEFEPDNAYILDSLGWAYYLQKKYDEAIVILQAALSKTPNDVSINDHLGDAYWQTGRRADAKLQWQRSSDYSVDDKEKAFLADKLKNGLPNESAVAEKPTQ